MNRSVRIDAVIREALVSLNDLHPEAFKKIVGSLQTAGHKILEVPHVEAAFRAAAAELKTDDEDAAETLLALADLLAEHSGSNMH